MKNVCSITSMQEMTDKFTEEECVRNLCLILGKDEKEFLPHYVTINECLEKLDTEELERFRNRMIRKLLRKRSFEHARFLGKHWLVIVDATQYISNIYNMYGPTETTIWSTVAELTHETEITIGYPIKETEIYLLDHTGNVVKNGQEEEICIAGEGLAEGYINNSEQTNKHFTYLPWDKNVRIYLTGDLGRYNSKN